MATNIGRVEFLVGADGRILERELRRIGSKAGASAGADTGKAFSKAFDGELGDMGAATLASWRGNMTRKGRNSGLLFGESWSKSALDVINRRAHRSMSDIAEAFTFKGDWDQWAKGFDSVTDAIERMEANLRTARREGGLNESQFERLLEKNKEYGVAALEVERAEKQALATRKSLREESERLSAVLSNRTAFTQHVREVGDLDTAYRRLEERIITVGRNADESGGWTLRMRAKLFDLADGFARIDAGMESNNRSMEKHEKAHGRHSRLIRSHVGRVIAMWTTLVLLIGQGTAALGSGVGAALTGLISSLGIGLVGALGLAGTAFSGFLVQIGLASNSLRFMREQVPAVDKAMDNLAEASERAGRRFAEAWGPSVARLLGTITELMNNTGIADAMAKSLSSITDAFDDALRSPGFQMFYEALATTIPNALTMLGRGFAFMSSGFAAMFAAASPALERFAGLFQAWADRFENTMQAMAADGRLQKFFQDALDTLIAIWDFVGSLTTALMTLFGIGDEYGNIMLGTLTGLVDKWNEWMLSVEGQTALQTWFENGVIIFDALIGLIGKVGEALNLLVTPESMERLVTFIEKLGEFMPIGAQILDFFGRLDILNIFVGALILIGSFLEPLMPKLLELADVIGVQLVRGVEDLSPKFFELGEKMAPVLGKLVDLAIVVIPPLIDAIIWIVDIINGWISIFEALGEATDQSGGDFDYWRDVVLVAIGAVLGTLNNFLSIGSGVLRTIGALLRGDFSGAFKAAEGVVRTVVSMMGGDFNSFKTTVSVAAGVISGIMSTIGQVFRTMGAIATGVMSNIKGAIDGVVGALRGIIDAARNAMNAIGNVLSGKASIGSLFGFAAGGVLSGPRRILAGEAGPEAIVPLNRPLGAVDPSVRWLSAIAQGKYPAMAGGGVAGSGKQVNINEGAIMIVEADDARFTANEVVTRIIERVAG